MNEILGNIGLIALFVVIGGVFAAAEMALVSLRESQVKQLATRGKRGRVIASLTEDPNRFLSAVQIGVTLSGFLSAAFGGATLEEPLARVLAGWGLHPAVASPVSLVLITVAISYFSIVLGELAAKRLAMQRAESFAMALAPLVNGIAKAARPVIWFLGVSTDAVVRVLGGDPAAAREEVSDEELRAMVGSSATLGADERGIVDEVFAAGQTSLREVMVPRTEVDFLEGSMPAHQALGQLREGTHSRCPVIGKDSDDVLGFVHLRDLVDLDPTQRNTPLSQLVRPVMSLPETVKILRALNQMRDQGSHLVIVRDEYGGTAGIVTIEDIVEELIGDITDEFDDDAAQPDGDFDGLLTLEDASAKLGYKLPEGPYDTLAGFVMSRLGAVPELDATCEAVLEPVEADGEPAPFRFRVSALDGRRAARVEVSRVARDAEVSQP
ncbi:MAG: hemolysin family protein [Propionibacteriaceae bacterium]|jgi:putative hemolysin|nr:hemolysin family protein [Propionibacteriaceae bacterium]